MAELDAIKSAFCDLESISSEFWNFIKDKPKQFCLSFDDYGKTSIAICSDKDGIIEFYVSTLK